MLLLRASSGADRQARRSMWETSYASGKAIINEKVQEMVQGQQAGAGVTGLPREQDIKERWERGWRRVTVVDSDGRNGAAEAFFSALGQQPISVVQLRRAGRRGYERVGG